MTVKGRLASSCILILIATIPLEASAQEKIKVTSAEYGYVNDKMDVTQVFAHDCNNSSSCDVPITNQHMGGDPSHNNVKHASATWRCGAESQSTSAQEGTNAHLYCD